MSARCTLVLGGSGFLGVHVLEAALARGGPVVCAGREPPLAVGLAGSRFERADALRDGDWERLLERERPARVVLCAALSRGADCEAYPALARRLNAELPGRVAGWCAANGARLVHVSTDLVFGREDAPPGGFREEHPPAPLGLYGQTKAAGERSVLEGCGGAAVARLPLLFGDSRGRGRGASDSLWEAVQRGGERPLLFTDEWRTPLDVADAAAALVELCGVPHAGPLHVAGPERLTRFELGLAALRARGLSAGESRERVRACVRADAGLDASRPRDVALDASRARSLLAAPLRGARQALAG